MTKMTELEMEEYLQQVFEAIPGLVVEYNSEDEEVEGEYTHLDIVENSYSFSQRGLLTKNKGVVINMKDGSRFQLTIVKEK